MACLDINAEYRITKGGKPEVKGKEGGGSQSSVAHARTCHKGLCHANKCSQTHTRANTQASQLKKKSRDYEREQVQMKRHSEER